MPASVTFAAFPSGRRRRRHLRFADFLRSSRFLAARPELGGSGELGGRTVKIDIAAHESPEDRLALGGQWRHVAELL